MTHFTHDELVLSYYGEPDPGARREHLDACADCRDELARLSRVLDQVTPADVPDPGDDYESRVWDRLHWRLRGETLRARRGGWVKVAAAAAVLALAFFAGLFWNRRAAAPVETAQTGTTGAVQPASRTQTDQQGRDRILLVVVGDHFDRSERMLIELTNLTPREALDFTTNRERAEDLLASNRLYRRTALDRGEENVATLLDELEPVLLQIARAPSDMSPDELRSIQKRVEAKELVFKLRVVRAGVRAGSTPPDLQQPNV